MNEMPQKSFGINVTLTAFIVALVAFNIIYNSLSAFEIGYCIGQLSVIILLTILLLSFCGFLAHITKKFSYLTVILFVTFNITIIDSFSHSKVSTSFLLLKQTEASTINITPTDSAIKRNSDETAMLKKIGNIFSVTQSQFKQESDQIVKRYLDIHSNLNLTLTPSTIVNTNGRSRVYGIIIDYLILIRERDSLTYRYQTAFRFNMKAAGINDANAVAGMESGHYQLYKDSQELSKLDQDYVSAISGLLQFFDKYSNLIALKDGSIILNDQQLDLELSRLTNNVVQCRTRLFDYLQKLESDMNTRKDAFKNLKAK